MTLNRFTLTAAPMGLTAEAFALVDQDGVIRECGGEIEQLAETPRRQLVGRKWCELESEGMLSEGAILASSYRGHGDYRWQRRFGSGISAPVTARFRRLGEWTLFQFHWSTPGVSGEQQLGSQNEAFEVLFENQRDAAVIFDSGTQCLLLANTSARTRFGLDGAALHRVPFDSLLDERERDRFSASAHQWGPVEPVTGPWTFLLAGGGKTVVELASHEICYLGRKARCVILHDTSERLRLQEHVARLERADVTAQVASGIVHDFNNLLSLMVGLSESAAEMAKADAVLARVLEQIQNAGHRAASLTRQLLSLSRRDTLERTHFEVNRWLAGSLPSLQRTVGSGRKLRLVESAEVAMVFADLVQVESAVLNLVCNARDATESGGAITISCEVRPKQDAAKFGSIAIKVADNGSGMDGETLRRVFDPYFTTKGAGQGSGLGLANVRAVARAHGGDVEVESQLHYGSVFTIVLPLASVAASGVEQSNAKPADPHVRGAATILLVDDEPALAALIATFLEEFGYTVYQTQTGSQAEAVAAQPANRIDLLIADVIMKERTGLEIWGRVKQLQPGANVLFISGYHREGLEKMGIPLGSHLLVEKPFSRQALLERVRFALRGHAAAAKA